MKLELRQVQKAYSDFKLNCSMEVRSGQVTGLIGRNGAGKSTTFKAVLGLIQIEQGSVLIDDVDVKRWDAKDKQRLGVVLSESGFSSYLTVADVIKIMSAMYEKFDKQAFEKLCKKFSIPLKKTIREFSTGMKAKLKVLIAMSHKAELLILDEPTTGLDVMAREEILDLLHSYMQDEKNSILISSHISSDLESLCDDIYLIEDGRIILHEETHVLLDEYGIIKVSREQYEAMDKTYLMSVKEESYGYRCLTKEKQFYLENYPELTIEKGSIDGVYSVLVQGKAVN